MIPESGGLHMLLMQELHCTLLSSHPGVCKTFNLLSAHVWWHRLRESVASFIGGYLMCVHVKYSTQKVAGTLQPLPIPVGKFRDYILDFITNLPLVAGCNAVMVIVDRLTK